MNKRIQELKDQCYISIVDRDGDTEYDMEKFARLITADCAELCADIDGGENMFSRAIRKHFGVEE